MKVEQWIKVEHWMTVEQWMKAGVWMKVEQWMKNKRWKKVEQGIKVLTGKGRSTVNQSWIVNGVEQGMKVEERRKVEQ